MSTPPRKYHSAYTVVLFVVAGGALFMVASHEMLIELMRTDGSDKDVVIILRFVQAIELLLGLFSFCAGVLRVKGTELAAPVTAAVSILMVFWVPLGTIAFFYWLFRVRPKERSLQG